MVSPGLAWRWLGTIVGSGPGIDCRSLTTVPGAGALVDATWAGVVAWVAYSLTGPAKFIPLGFYSESLWISVCLYQLVFSIIAAIVGAAPYGEKTAAAH